jgi:hypothetical protein
VTFPTDLPVWRALAAEAGIASDQIGEGATLLSKVSPSYAWTFSRAFFPLSIGLERACKLALHVDAKLASGEFLDEKQMRELGHKLDRLMEAVDAMNHRRGFGHARPIDPINNAVLAVLTEFATNGRYHHLDNLAGRASGADPSKLWWDTVIVPILAKHYRPRRRASDQAVAAILGSALEDHSLVRYNHVDGSTVSSMTEGLREGARIEAATPWARMYTLQLARWLATSMKMLSYESHRHRDPEIPELHEFFYTFGVDDSYMRSRKTWRPSH